MYHLNRLLLIGLCTATLAGCGGGTAEPAATPDASAAASAQASDAAPAGPANLPVAAQPSSAAFARPLVVSEAAFVRVTPPPRPDNGKVEVHPGIRPREPGDSGHPSHAVGAPSTRTPLSGR